MLTETPTSQALPPMQDQDDMENGAPIALALVFLGSIAMFAGTFCWLLFF